MKTGTTHPIWDVTTGWIPTKEETYECPLSHRALPGLLPLWCLA